MPLLIEKAFVDLAQNPRINLTLKRIPRLTKHQMDMLNKPKMHVSIHL